MKWIQGQPGFMGHASHTPPTDWMGCILTALPEGRRDAAYTDTSMASAPNAGLRLIGKEFALRNLNSSVLFLHPLNRTIPESQRRPFSNELLQLTGKGSMAEHIASLARHRAPHNPGTLGMINQAIC